MSDPRKSGKLTDAQIDDALSQLDDDASPKHIACHIAEWAIRDACDRMIMWLEKERSP